jgi:putative ABC transport system permease protein
VGLVTSVLGWPMCKTAGVAGRMAQKNAARNSRRTATTAAALMIGLALVSTALVVGQSIKANIGTTFDDVAVAEYYVTDQLEEVDFPSSLAAQVRSWEAVDAATGFSFLEARVDGSVTDIAAADFDELPLLLDLDVTSGGYDTTVVNPVVISGDEADSLGLAVGDRVATEFANGSTVEAVITGIFNDQVIISEDYLFDAAVFEAGGLDEPYEWLAYSVADGADANSVQALSASLSAEFPHADVETSAEFQDRVVGFVDDTLAIVNVMVALAVIIALIGIANTLALSVFERTRELGLVRAVGMTRRQLRRMVRFEAALVATFGAVLGVGIGLLFGYGVVGALPESLATSVSIPTANILILMLVAAVAGVVAAWLPARRAGRLNVLDAISH